MAVESASTLKSYLETGDLPTQAQFENIIDSTHNQNLSSGIIVDSSNRATVVLSELNGTASNLTAGSVITNANLTGDVTSVGNATTIANNAVTSAKINDLAVTTGKINDLGVTTGKINDLAVTNAKLAKLEVSTPTYSANNYTLILTDDGKCLNLSNGGSAGTLTIPTNASVAFAVGTQILLRQTGSGTITITASGGVTIQSESSLVAMNGQYAGATLVKVATDTWALFGNLA